MNQITPHELAQITAADPYMAGYAAQANGLPCDNSNPAWQAGWSDAAADDREPMIHCSNCGKRIVEGESAGIGGKIVCWPCSTHGLSRMLANAKPAGGQFAKQVVIDSDEAFSLRPAYKGATYRQRRLLD